MMRKTIIVERDVEVRMRDGVILRADVYRPDTTTPLPVLLQRTPYGKGFSNPAFAIMAAERGYAVVIQDTRGRWASDGDGQPFIYEQVDGYDTVQWAAAQNWANGKVGMYGGSYVGYTQWAAAVSHPPALKTIIPSVTFCDLRSAMYKGGVLTLGVAVSWNLISTAFMAIQKSEEGQAEKDRLMALWIEAVDNMAKGQTFMHLPLKDLPLLGCDGIVSFFADMMSDPMTHAFWEKIRCAHEDIDIPVFHIGGWYDIFVDNTLEDFAGIQMNSGSKGARNHQKLLLGPWLHGPMEGLVGEVDFGLAASSMLVLPEEVQLRWFDYWLKDEPNGVIGEAPIRIFVMGENTWRDEQEWPLARTVYVPYYLHSNGAANTLRGDGVLNTQKPAHEPSDKYVYDPSNPVPTRGGALCCYQAALPPGAYDQRDIESRPDVLVYTTEPLPHDVEITGPLQGQLWAVTDAPDTDFTVKLVDVSPCGYARNVQDGIIRARYRTSSYEENPIKPGEVIVYVIDMAATSNVFKAGHQIRIEVSSSNFPRFDRNLNTGSVLGQDSVIRVATQTILHDADHPSHILLPLIPRE
jgi:putative CocE/NonD family hydrolase